MKTDNQNKILLIGDLIVVEYLYGSISGINKNNGSIEIDRDNSEIKGEGIINIAKGIASRGLKCDVIGACGSDTASRILQEELVSSSIDPDNLIIIPEGKTDLYTRIKSGNKEICEIRNVSKKAVNDSVLINNIFIQESSYMTTGGDCIRYVIETAKILGIPVYLDSSGNYKEKYIGLNTIFLDLDGFKRMSGIDINIDPDKNDIEIFALSLIDKYKIGEVIIYLGIYGAFRIIKGSEILYMPGYDNASVDQTGSRNSFVATYISSIISGGSPEGSLKISNISSSITSKYIGEFIPDLSEIVEFMSILDKNGED